VWLVVGVTGSVVVFVPELRRMEVPGWTRVEPAGTQLPLETLLERVLKNRAGDRMVSIYFDFKPNWSLNYRSVAVNGDRVHTFVDQYRGNILGSINYNHSRLQWVYDLHADLLGGTAGRKVNAWFAFALGIASSAGMLLWWRGQQHWKSALRYHSRSSWKGQIWDLHNLGGFFFFLPLFILSITGAWFAYEPPYTSIVSLLTRGPAEIPPPKAWGSGQRRSLDEILASAQRALADSVPSMIIFPAKAGEPFSLRMKRPTDPHRIGLNWVYVDPVTAQVLRVDRFDQQPIGVKIIRLMTPLHYGTFGGLPTRLLWVIAGLLPGLLFMTGLLMWWNRSLSKKRRRMKRDASDREEPRLPQAIMTTILPFVFILTLSGLSRAQTAATATVVGTVVDNTGGAVAGASVELVDQASQLARRQSTNEAGQFTISGIAPGKYRVTASAPGFRQSSVSDFEVDVAKSYVLNFTLAVGSVSEVLDVTAGPAVELQTLDSTIGVVIQGESLLRMPAINRSAMTFFTLQPLVAPTRGQISLQAGQHVTGQVAGARADQSTFTLDGLNVTDITAGTNFYSAAATDFGGPTPVIPVPADDIDEFRLSITNTNATFRQSAGGQVSLISKRGGNEFHGSAYSYIQNDALNANRWEYNRAGIRRPPLHDTRFGGSLGGPISRNKTFIYSHYEGRRLPQTAPVTRLVPSGTLRQGILRFLDGTGTVRSYDVKDFDPRGIGMSPVVRQMWSKLPAGNNATLGDGLNTTGFLAPVDSSLRMDFGVARIDHVFSDRWRLDAAYRYASQFAFGTSQVDIAGFAPGHVSGEAAPAARTNVQPRTFSVHLSANLSNNLLHDLVLGDAR
jgi:uncharacterized iron-regulated membrane protein